MTLEFDSTSIESILELLTREGLDGLSQALETLLNEAMKIERGQYLHAKPYERSSHRQGYANGYKPKRFQTRMGGLDLCVPQVRGTKSFEPQSLEKGLRSERALKLAIAEMYVQGVSTRRVTEITQKLCGLEVSSTQVSRAAKLLDDQLEPWRTRPLGQVPYLILDARYEKVRHGGSVINEAVLVAIGVQTDGKRSVLGVSVSLSEAEVHWREFLSSLTQRGLSGVELIVSDDHAGIKAALKAVFGSKPWQRCQFHLQRNAQAYVTKRALKEDVAQAIREIFNAPDREEAHRQLQKFGQKYQKEAPKLVLWAEVNLPEGFTIFDFPKSHQKRLRTTNSLERLNKEIKRRTRVASLFPNEDALLRLVSALLAEISEDWEIGKIYLNMKSGLA